MHTADTRNVVDDGRECFLLSGHERPFRRIGEEERGIEDGYHGSASGSSPTSCSTSPRSGSGATGSAGLSREAS